MNETHTKPIQLSVSHTNITALLFVILIRRFHTGVVLRSKIILTTESVSVQPLGMLLCFFFGCDYYSFCYVTAAYNTLSSSENKARVVR